MTEERNFDRTARAWLEAGPNEAPDRVIAAVLQAVDVTPQVRSRYDGRPFWRFPALNRMRSAAAVAVAIVLLAGAGLWLNRPADPVVGPGTAASPSPIVTPAASPAAASPTLSTPTSTPSATSAPTAAAAASSPASLPASGRATAIAAGYAFTCALTSSGGVRCWGHNSRGQLGNGTTADSRTPVDVSGLTSGVTAIASSYQGTCALTSPGGVQCWGRNDGGQLGNGKTADSSIPVDVSGLTSGVTGIAAAGGWFCALTGGGGVKCWGWNAGGQLGNGTTGNQWTPVDVAGLAGGVTAIAGGGRHTCALTTTGGVKCWGINGNGELGDGSTTASLSPVNVVGLAGGVTAIAAGDFYTCALLRAGGVKCWGQNQHGQLGNGTTTDSSTPVNVSGLATGVAAITATRGAFVDTYHACALMTGGGVKCWGLNSSGQLGNGTTTDSSIPVDVSGLTSGATAITTGAGHSCALTDSGGIKCWGKDYNGQLGDGKATDSSIPVDVKGL